jgi:magnesium-transporting ATPase (P-type)
MLRRLLLFHGRTSYARNTDMILFFFYKNFVFTITHFYYGFYNNFSGQTIIDDWFISLYNMIFTAFPLGARACMDFDVKPEDGKIVSQMMPFLYRETRERPSFTKTTFVLNLFRGIVHGLINFFFLVFTLGVTSVNKQGDHADMWYFSVNCFTNMIAVK